MTVVVISHDFAGLDLRRDLLPVAAAAQQGKARADRLEKEHELASAIASAETAVGQRDWPKAIAEYERVARVYPQDALARLQLAQAYERKGRSEAARHAAAPSCIEALVAELDRGGFDPTVTASDDTWLIGRHLEVLDAALSGTATARRLLVEDKEG